jgi:hypothetical protein
MVTYTDKIYPYTSHPPNLPEEFGKVYARVKRK